jgi:hypothetical protein
MSLSAVTHLGLYEFLALLGADAMRELCRGRDTGSFAEGH